MMNKMMMAKEGGREVEEEREGKRKAQQEKEQKKTTKNINRIRPLAKGRP